MKKQIALAIAFALGSPFAVAYDTGTGPADATPPLSARDDPTSPADATPPLSARNDPTRPADATPSDGAHHLDPRFAEPTDDYARIRAAAGAVGPSDPREFDPRSVDPLVPSTNSSAPPSPNPASAPATIERGGVGPGSSDLAR